MVMQYRLHHTAISVRNLEESVAIYEALGYRKVHQYDEEDGSMSGCFLFAIIYV